MYSVVMAAMLMAGGETTTWHHRCHGCYGGCHGCYGGCYGGWAGCWGCYGCSGCHGCWGGYGCYGCYGSFGCYGCCGCCGGGVILSPVVPSAPVAPTTPPPPPPGASLNPGANGYVSAQNQGIARITINIPSQGKLFVDNVQFPMTNASKTFVTPALRPGVRYFYNMRMEIEQNGQTVSQTRRVDVVAGETLTVNFFSNQEEQRTAQAND